MMDENIEHEGRELVHRVAKEWMAETELIPLALIALEVEEPIELVADRLGEAVQLDDVGMRAVPAEVARRFLTERAEQTARMREQSRRLQEVHRPLPVGGGVPALEDASPLESLMNGDRSYMSRGGVRRASEAELPGGGTRGRSPAAGRGARRDRCQEGGQGPMTKTIWVRPKGSAPRPGTKLRVQLEQKVGGRPLHAVGEAEVYEGGRALVRLIDSSAGVGAAILLQEGLVDPVYWGSQPTLGGRPVEGGVCLHDRVVPGAAHRRP